MSVKKTFDRIIGDVMRACRAHYGERLVSLAVFGSAARGGMRADSDIDLLLVVEGLPQGRLARVRDFDAIEAGLAEVLAQAKKDGVHTSLSPVFKTPEEVEQGSLLFLDMTDQAKILFDRNGFLRGYLDNLAGRLAKMGARRVYRGGGYYWLLKPDLKPGEDIAL